MKVLSLTFEKYRHLPSCVFPSSAAAVKPCTTLPFICLGRRFEQDLKTLSRAFLVAMSRATLGDRRSLRGTWILIGLLAAYLLGRMAAFCGVRCSNSVGNRFHPDRFSFWQLSFIMDDLPLSMLSHGLRRRRQRGASNAATPHHA